MPDVCDETCCTKSTPDIVHLAAIAAGIQIHAAIDHQVIGARPPAVGRPGGHTQAGGGRHLVLVEQRDARHQRDQLQIVAAVERQILHLLRIDGARSSPETVLTLSPETSVTVMVR